VQHSCDIHALEVPPLGWFDSGVKRVAILLIFCVLAVGTVGSVVASPTTAAASARSAPSQTDSGPSGRVESLELSNSTQHQLLGLYARYRHMPTTDIARIDSGSVHGARVVTTGQEWAMVSFAQSVNAPPSVLIGFQDGGGTGIFSRAPAGHWKMLGMAVLPTGCGPLLSSAIRQLWHIADCQSATGGHLRPDQLTTGDVASIAENSVGVADNPASTSFGFDCNPFTSIEVGTQPSSGCGVNSTYDVTNESEEWCADFVKWVWAEAGVTTDLGTLTSLSSSFYTWGYNQGQPMTVDGTNPQVGDALVLYLAGTAPIGYTNTPPKSSKPPEVVQQLEGGGQHVGIITGVNANGTVNIVNGDFLDGSNIQVEYDPDVSVASWAAGIWGAGAEWVYVSPNLPAPSPEPVSATPDTTWDDLFQSYGDTSGAWNGGDGAQSLRLPNGNTVWFFADTYLGQVDPDGTRPPLSTGNAHNSAVVYNARRGTLGPTEAVSPGSGGYSWDTDYSWVTPPPGYPAPQYELINGDQVTDSGTVYKFYQLADTSLHPNNFGYKLVGTVLESFAINGSTLTPEGGVPLGAVENSGNSNPIIWGTAVLVSDGYIYIYGTRPYNTTAVPSANAYPLYLARVPVGHLSGGTADWQYYDYGASCNPPADAWSSDSSDLTALMPGGASAGFSVTDVNGTYVLLTNNSTGTSNNAVAYYASCPTGFSASSPEHTIYQPDVPAGYLTYEYRIVPQFSSGSDVLVSYSVDTEREDGSCLGENYYNAAIYRPQFLDVLLPDINGSSGGITKPPFDSPPPLRTPPVSPDNFYTPTQDYPGTSTEMQDFCTTGASPANSPKLTVPSDVGDVIDLNWSLQPSAMWLYTVVYCNVSRYGSKCPSNLVGPAGNNLVTSIPACNNKVKSNPYCGYNLAYGNTNSTLEYLIPGDYYKMQIAAALAVSDGTYVGSNVITDLASPPTPALRHSVRHSG
jgi:hypothetical protein